MAEAPAFTLYLASARYDQPRFQPQGVYLCRLTGPEGFEPITFGASPLHPILTREADPLYAGLLDCLGRLPDGCRLRVVTADSYLHGTATDPGIFNTTPAEREAREYRRASARKGGPLANVAQLREIDALLIAKGIVMEASRPAAGDEERAHSGVREGAKELLREECGTAPWDRGR